MQKLDSILSKRSGIDFSCCEDLKKENLLGQKIGMTAGELLHVFFDLEREYGIAISEDDITNGAMMTYNSIEKMLNKYVKV